MKNYLIGLSVLFLSACYDTDFNADAVVSEADLNYLSPNSAKEDFPHDPYRIIAVTPLSINRWSVVMEYGGGCYDHIFNTWWDGTFQNTTPSKVQLHLLHNSLGDACEAIVRDTVVLDFRDVFQGRYNSDAYVELHNESIGQVISLDPFVAKYVLDAECELAIQIANANCSQGIWDQKWIQVMDSIPYHSSIWFQPVRVADGIEAPELGSYKIGVSLLFGLEYGGAELACSPANVKGEYPVMVNCLAPQ